MVVINSGKPLKMTNDEYISNFVENTSVFRKISKKEYNRFLDLKRFPDLSPLKLVRS
jgi:hypothetical protein